MTAGFVMRDHRDGFVTQRHEVTADHVGVGADRITAEPGTTTSAGEILDGFVDLPTAGREMGFDSGNCAGVQTMGAVVDDWISGNGEIVSAFAGDIGTTLTRLAHHAVAVDDRRRLEKKERKDDMECEEECGGRGGKGPRRGERHGGLGGEGEEGREQTKEVENVADVAIQDEDIYKYVVKREGSES